MDRLSVNQLAFLDIICCGLHGKTADIGDANVEYLYKQCKRHNLTVIGYAGMPTDVRTEEWRQEREKAIRKSLIFNF
ncbi:MAG: hypothetical protein KBS66_05555 [Eubacterium sp.]|nr:hypothetical protein [Candidatus Colimonas fimequi]